MMVIGKTLYITKREEWRSWLSEHHQTEPEIWLIYYRKESGKARISYDDAVCEALCFGWIDSTVKNIDSERFAQRFSPRRPTSSLSQMNKERVRQLLKEKRMTKAGMEAISHVYNSKADAAENFIIPPDILKALKSNQDAWINFQKLPLSYRRIRIAYIESRKRHGPDLYKKSLAYFVEMTALDKRIGFVRERRGDT